MKNKKPLAALIALLLLGVVGVTFAYFTTTESVPNEFRVGGSYGSKIVETFPFGEDDRWLPGQQVEKVVNVNNTGEIPMVVRMKYTEAWDPSTLSGLLSDGTSRAAIISTIDTTKWKYDGSEWYYYYKVLDANTSTDTPFIEHVTLNPNLDQELDANYLGKKYTLTVTAETIQADGALDVAEWADAESLVTGLA